MAFVLSLLVPHLSFCWCLGKAVLHDCGVFLVPSLKFVRRFLDWQNKENHSSVPFPINVQIKHATLTQLDLASVISILVTRQLHTSGGRYRLTNGCRFY